MEIPELRALDAAMDAEILRRQKDMRLPKRRTRFRALRGVTVDGATYLRIPSSETVVPIDVWRVTIQKGDVVSLNYEPPVEASTHCSVLPDRYDHYETACVESRFRQDAGYVGYAFSVSYLQLDQDFEWLPPDSSAPDRPIEGSVMAAWLKEEMANNRLNASGGSRWNQVDG